MKRLLVVGLLFGIAVTSGMAWFAWAELSAERAQRAKDDLVLSDIVRRRTEPVPAPQPHHNSPLKSARWDAPRSNLLAEVREIQSHDRQVRFAADPPVSGRFSQPVLPPEGPTPPTFADNQPGSRFAEPFDPHAFVQQPMFDEQPSAPLPVAVPVSDEPPPPFSNNDYYVPGDGQVPRSGLDSVNLIDGMAYVIHVHRAAENAPPVHISETHRMLAGKPKSVKEPATRHDRAELRIYAESIETKSTDGDFAFECSGKFVIVTDNSVLRGKGLKYADGRFAVTAPEIDTPDASIKSSDASFEYEVSAISISAIRVDAEAEVPDEPRNDDPRSAESSNNSPPPMSDDRPRFQTPGTEWRIVPE